MPEVPYVAVSKNWGPLRGCPCNKSSDIWSRYAGPLIIGNSHVLQ